MRVLRIPHSTNVDRVALALGHKGLAVEWVDVDPADRGPVRALSGQELVPVLQLDDGEVLADSRAILRRLEADHPDPPLWPADAAARAQADIFAGVVRRGLEGRRRTAWPPGPGPRARATPTRPARVDGPLRGAARRRPAVPARRRAVTVADVLAQPFLRYGAVRRSPATTTRSTPCSPSTCRSGPGPYPRLRAWVERVDALPAASILKPALRNL